MAHPYSAQIVERFWSKVVVVDDEHSCWLWKDAAHYGGYGTMLVGQPRYAHRISYEIANDCTLNTGLHVCHKCDVPLCVRPSHLFLGTASDNLRDASAKGKLHRKPNGTSVRLSESDVLQILELNEQGVRSTTLARQFGVTDQTICDIRKGRSWKHITARWKAVRRPQ